MFFIFLQKLFSFLRYSDFRILKSGMPKHDRRNTYYWITWEEKTQRRFKFDHFMLYHERESLIKKLSQMCPLEIGSRSFFISKEPSVKTNLVESTCWLWHIFIDLPLRIQYFQLVSKTYFAIEVVLNPLLMQKRLELVSRQHFSVNFFKKFDFCNII